MLRRPPRSTLFPTRRSSDLDDPMRFNLAPRLEGAHPIGEKDLDNQHSYLAARPATIGALRSEEHTSELQSLAYLVCRLLLEKKNITSNEPNNSPSTND